MVKVLNREGIQRMVGRGSGSVGSGGSSGDGGGISIAQVDAAYVSKAFFDQLFTVHGKRTYTDPETHEEVTEDVIISPNQIAEGEYSLSNVEVSVGLWTQQFLSALGLNSGGGGGGATALTDLVDVALSNPQNGQALVYNSSTGKWVNGTVTPDLSDYATKAWVQQQGYITASAISDMATKAWVGQQGYATQQWVQQQNYITASSLNGYATQQWVQQQNYITASALNGYATQQWVGQQGFLKASDLNGYATQQWVGQNYLGVNDTAAAATKLQTARTIFGQSFDGTANVSGNVECTNVFAEHEIRFHESGNWWWTLGYEAGSSNSSFNLVRYNNSTYVTTVLLSADTNGGISVNSGQLWVKQAAHGIRIGDGVIQWDSTNNALKVIKSDGMAANFYATGGVSALGMSAGVSTVDAMTFNHLSVKNSMTLSGSVSVITGSSSIIVRSSSDSDCLYLFNDYTSSKINSKNYYYNQYDNVGLLGKDYNYSDTTWWIDPDGCARFKRLYLDSSRYLYINGGTLYYYNGSTSRQIAFA